MMLFQKRVVCTKLEYLRSYVCSTSTKYLQINSVSAQARVTGRMIPSGNNSPSAFLSKQQLFRRRSDESLDFIMSVISRPLLVVDLGIDLTPRQYILCYNTIRRPMLSDNIR
jgi:hypothetical protein